MRKESKLATQAELNEVARRMKSKTQSFGKEKSEKYAREAKARIDAFARKVKI